MKLPQIVVSGLLVLQQAALPCYAQEPKQEQAVVEEEKALPIDIHLKTDFMSKYVFRGFTYSEEPVIQQTVSLSHKGLAITGWANYDTELEELTEADLMIDYTMELGERATLTLGYAYMTFPNTPVEVQPSDLETFLANTSAALDILQTLVDPEYVPPKEEEAEPQYTKETITTQEVYASLTLNTPLSPTLFVAHDFDEGKGTYAELSVSYDFELGKADLSTRAAIGYNNHYFREDSGLSHLELGLALPIELTENITMTPSATMTKSLADDFQDEMIFGLGFEFNF